jgi:xylose isomerase
MKQDEFTPSRADRFTFGLWTVGNAGRDPFGAEVRAPLAPRYMLERLSALGAFGVSLHDNDLLPFEASLQERERIVRDFRQALAETGMKLTMATTNLFFHPIFKDGAFTANDPRVRAFALQKVMRGIDLAAELDARVYVFWGGREGVETDAAKDPREAIKRYREAMNFICEYVLDQKYDIRLALEAKPNEPRGDIFLSTTGHALHFIETLDHPEMVGVNPEMAHEQMAGLNFVHAVAQALEAGKLFHIDLNDQKGPRYDQDLRFASENLKASFFLVKLLEDAGYEGPKHFDAHPYRTEDESGVWDFALGCMRSYKILQAKVKRFNEDPEIQDLLSELRGSHPEATGLLGAYSSEKATRLKGLSLDVDGIARQGLGYEQLDQLVTELLLGAH